jgi:porphobilinogen deaminase
LGLEKIKNGEADAMTISKHTLISLGVDEANFDILRINPKEFVPEVGQGIGAVVVASDNMMLRKMFKQIHNADTAAVSNVERSILKLYQQNGEQNVLVHCEQDAQRNYHVTAFDAKGRRARMSSVTSFKLAEFVYQSLIS